MSKSTSDRVITAIKERDYLLQRMELEGSTCATAGGANGCYLSENRDHLGTLVGVGPHSPLNLPKLSLGPEWGVVRQLC